MGAWTTRIHHFFPFVLSRFMVCLFISQLWSNCPPSLRWPDVYLGLTTMGQNMSVPSLKRALRHAMEAAPSQPTSTTTSITGGPVVTVELMVHPGYPSHPQEGGCGEGPDAFSQSADRQHELTALQDTSLLALYTQELVQLCAFKDLWVHLSRNDPCIISTPGDFRWVWIKRGKVCWNTYQFR